VCPSQGAEGVPGSPGPATTSPAAEPGRHSLLNSTEALRAVPNLHTLFLDRQTRRGQTARCVWLSRATGQPGHPEWEDGEPGGS